MPVSDNDTQRNEEYQDRSFVYNFKKLSIYEKITFWFSPGAPIIALLSRPYKSEQRKKCFWGAIILTVSLILLGTYFNNVFNSKLFTQNPWYDGIITLGYFLLLNIVCFLIYIILDFHNIISDSFHNSTENQLKECFEEILGHKLWSGKNAIHLFNSMIKKNNNIGRAKWLLVNFLRDDIENKILSKDDCEYTITGKQWKIPEYSLFLKENLHHAEKNVYWLVDPNDFFSELIPSCIADVIISLAIHKNNKSWEELKLIVEGKKDRDGITLLAVLNDIKMPQEYCPMYCLGICTKNSENNCEECEIQVDGNKPILKSKFLDYIWRSFFAQGLALLSEARVSEFTDSIVIDGLFKRESLCRDYYLPHMFEFRKLAIEDKRRYIYLGKNKTSEIKLFIKNYSLISAKDYCSRLFPRINPEGISKEMSTLEFDGWWGKIAQFSINNKDSAVHVQTISDAEHRSIAPELSRISGETKNLQTQSFPENQGIKPKLINNKYYSYWGKMDDLVVNDLIEKAFNLFEYGSGSAVKGVANEEALHRDYTEGKLDIGIYDDNLLIYSEKSPENKNLRDITWKYYAKPNSDSNIISALIKAYFPDESKTRRLVPIDTIKKNFLEKLKTGSNEK